MNGVLLAWLALLPMALAGVWLGAHEVETPWVVASILLLALGKAWIIALCFMELRHGPRVWRWLLLGWPLVMALVLFLLQVMR
ncbi:MAG: hypothetical protein GAK43_02741 [Stenotrophomonas maltophilia]|nr:MAG: hypothetical protein GAK43_02741 [Stenotrophomonas maltophilia]